ncbi:MAG: signal peptide peptidase SppA [Bacteroidales bacterium]|nr:signal peptide peptidase SppA [Bacteroidales bacterium]
MKSFLKYTLATITGLLIAGVLFFFISLAGLSLMIASAEKPVSIRSNSVLVLNTGLIIPEKGTNDPFSSFDPINFTFTPAPGINDILKNLEKAADDEKIKGVLIENGLMINGWGKAEEIRNALLRFKESGKFLISYTDYILSQESYYISSVADKIYVNPNTMMEFKGLVSEITFYKDALEKLGVNVQVIRHGKYKGAVEKFMLNELSAENREQITDYLNGMWKHVVSQIGQSRKLSVEKLNQLADNLVSFDISKAMEEGLVDGLMYRDEIIEELKTLTGTEENKNLEKVTMAKYRDVEKVTKGKGKKGKIEASIAVVYAEGTINMGKTTSGMIGGDGFASILRKIREKGDHEAVVLRLNSPGGNAMASDNMWREIRLLSDSIPVVVSMSNYAASGGYYISAPATKIFAQPTTLTGSIGVYVLFPEVSGLMENKLGIKTDVVKTNEKADILSPYRGMSGEEQMIFQQHIDRTYNEFVSRVSEGRDIPQEKVDDLGQGHVYAGRAALDLNLVDKIGGLRDAIDEAARLASLDDYEIKEYPEEEDPFEKLIKSLTGDMKSRIIRKELGEMARHYDDINELKTLTGIQARLPYFIEIR